MAAPRAASLMASPALQSRTTCHLELAGSHLTSKRPPLHSSHSSDHLAPCWCAPLLLNRCSSRSQMDFHTSFRLDSFD